MTRRTAVALALLAGFPAAAASAAVPAPTLVRDLDPRPHDPNGGGNMNGGPALAEHAAPCMHRDRPSSVGIDAMVQEPPRSSLSVGLCWDQSRLRKRLRGK